jgi:hypothetical protein
MTINEVRELYGFPPIAGGETLYQSATMVPLGEAIPPKVTAEKFFEIMRQQINSNGERMFPEEAIIRIARERGLIA